MLRLYSYITLTILIFLSFYAEGQNKAPYYEVVKNDSVALFFNERSHFIEKKCADYKRLVRVDRNGNFQGPFKDITFGNAPRGMGNYKEGKKHGLFELYHPNGKIFCRGEYNFNIPVGKWQFFHETGLPERTLQLTSTDTLLIQLVSPKGDIVVLDGNGEFEGLVSARSNSNAITAKGKIVNGKPSGKWTSFFGKAVYCKEEFVDGKLVKGSFPNVKEKEGRNYTHKSFLNTFFLGHYAIDLEQFKFEDCADSAMYASDKYAYNTRTFTSTLSTEIDHTITSDIIRKNTLNYWNGDQYITMEFTADKNGKPAEFKLLSTWGRPFVNAMSAALRSVVRTAPQKKMYLHIRLGLSISGGYSSFNYRYLISDQPVIRAADTMY